MATPFKRAAIPRVSIGSLDVDDPDLGDGLTSDNPTTAVNPVPGAPITLDAPTLLAPPDGFQLPWWSDTVTLWWAANKSVEFRVQVSTSPEFEGSRTQEFSTTSVQYEFTPTRDRYYWRVKAIDAINGRFSPWSEVWGFSRPPSINYDQQPGPGQTDTGADAAPDAPTPPGPDDETETDPDDPGEGEGGVEAPPIVIGLILIAPTPPLPLGGSASVTAEIESDHPIVTYDWSLIVDNDGGTMVDTNQATAGYTAPNFVTDDLVVLTVTDSVGNVATSEAVPILVRDTATDDPADTDPDTGEFDSTGCTTKLNSFAESDLNPLGWGADTTSEDPVDPEFPDGSERFSADAKQHSDFGAVVWSAGSGWFRYYVKGHKVKLFYPASNRSGKLYITVHRLNPHFQSAQLVGNIAIDQSAAVVDDDGDECWYMREEEIDFAQLVPGEDPEWVYYAITDQLKRYVYRLTFTYLSAGEFTGTEYGSWFVALAGIQQFRQHQYHITVDDAAGWNAGTHYGSFVSANELHGYVSYFSGQPQGVTAQRRTFSPLKQDEDYQVARADAFSTNLAAVWTPVLGSELTWQGRVYAGAPVRSVDIFAYCVEVAVRRAELVAGTTATLRCLWSVWTQDVNVNLLPPAGLEMQLRRGDPAGFTEPLPGVFIAAADYWAFTPLVAGGYVWFNVSADTLLALPDDGLGLTYLWLHFVGAKAYNPLPLVDPEAAENRYIALAGLELRVIGTDNPHYLSEEFTLDKTYDYRGITDLTNLVSYLVDESGPPNSVVFWRAARVAVELPNATWYSDLRAAMRNIRVGAIQFMVEFNSTSLGWVSRIIVFIKERL